jgi:hypothetical protein
VLHRPATIAPQCSENNLMGSDRLFNTDHGCADIGCAR